MKKEVRVQSVRDKETVVRAQSVRDKETVVRAQSVRDKETVIKAQRVKKGQGVRPRSKDRVTSICKKTSPGQMIGRTMRKTSCKKLDITRVFSIVDTEFEQRSNNQHDQLYRSKLGEITW